MFLQLAQTKNRKTANQQGSRAKFGLSYKRLLACPFSLFPRIPATLLHADRKRRYPT